MNKKSNTSDNEADNVQASGEKKKTADDKAKGGSQVTGNAGYGAIPNGISSGSGKFYNTCTCRLKSTVGIA
jgi:hypothetical protein